MSSAASFEDDLKRGAGGDAAARARLWAEHYELLHACAASYLARQWGRADGGDRISLGATDVLHEAFLRLLPRLAAVENGRSYFFRAFHRECMRIVVEHYRRTKNHRGRGDAKRLPFESEVLPARDAALDVDAVIDAIEELERLDARAGQIAFLRVVEGKTIAQCAALLGYSVRTVEGDWSFAKAWLDRRLNC